MIKNWFQINTAYFKDKRFVFSLLASLLLLAVAITVIMYAITYATESSSNYATDIILSNIRVFDVDGIFLYGPVFFWLVILGYAAWKPEKIPFTLDSIVVFLLVRAVFISLTHLGPFPTHLIINSKTLMGEIMSGNDLFFSGHTGFPYLMALVFWENKLIRYFCLACSIIFGIVVLLAHLHYSIDVLGAFFITFSIYHITLKLFKKDHLYFISSRG